MEKLRAAFETAGVHHLRAVLVTRAQTLLRAANELARESNDALLVRHPRMLAFSLQHVVTLDEAADLTLGTALDPWRATRTCKGASAVVSNPTSAVSF